MMNNNKKAINKLTLSTLKNKTKTLFMFVSIILVTFMIYSIQLDSVTMTIIKPIIYEVQGQQVKS